MSRQDKIDALMETFLHMKRSINRQMIASDACAITPVQTEILALVSHGTNRVADIATVLHATPSAATQQVSQLVDSGMISKTESTTDKREQLLCITSVGENVLATKRRLMHARLGQFVDALSDDELDQFIQICNKITNAEKE